MKIKIRGLIFTGFAAAVFAQSASAAWIAPPSQVSPELSSSAVKELKTTVTSQYYTDETFQGRILPTEKLHETNGSVDEKAAFIGWHYGQNGEPQEWVKLEGNKQLGTGNNAQEYVEIVHDNKNGEHKHYVQMNSDSIATGVAQILAGDPSTGSAVEQGKLTTASAVYGLLDRETTNGSTTITDQSGNDEVPTSKNVYDFVQDEIDDLDFQPKLTAADGPQAGQPVALNIGFWDSALNNGDGDSTWGKVKAQADGAGGTGSVGYLAITGTTSKGVYEININADKIVNGGSALVTAATSSTAADNKKLATALAVHDYAVKKDWGTPNGNKILYVDPTTGLVDVKEDDSDILDGAGTCATAAGGEICALVAYWDGTLNGNQGGIAYEWTVMAPRN